ncbi:MAG: DUF1653 domain-containing protein [Candidatus Saccharimonadales bacterium]
MNLIAPGIYVHYKSDDMKYEVLGVGRNTETNEEYVIYRPLYDVADRQGFWVRPYEMFTDTIEIDSKTMSRFRKVSEE